MPKRRRSPSPADMSNESRRAGLEVNIVDFKTGARLPQIHISKTRFHGWVRANRYVIFAQPGQKFAIEIITDLSFHWGDANALEVTIAFDLGNVVNEKRLYLERPMQGVHSSNLTEDNALGRMFRHSDGYSFYIDHILIQDPGSDLGRVNSFSFSFADVRGENAMPSSRKARSSKKTSEHQGKIRIQVAKIVVEASGDRRPGLHDNVTRDRRPSTATLLENDLAIEVRLDKVKTKGLMDYGGAFRPSACRRHSGLNNFVVEFLYRSVDAFPDIVGAQFKHEIGEHALFHMVEKDVASPSGVQIASESFEGFKDCETQDVSGTVDDIKDSVIPPVQPSIPSLRTTTIATLPIRHDSDDGTMGPRSSITSATPMHSPATSVQSSTWRMVQETLLRCEDQHKGNEEQDLADMTALRDELEALERADKQTSTSFTERRVKLARDEAACLKEIAQQKQEVRVKMEKLQLRCSARVRKVEMALGALQSAVEIPDEC